MSTFGVSARRLVLAGGFAVAIAAAPAVAAFAVPTSSTPLADCPAGEEQDTFTGSCTPHTVPNSPEFSASPDQVPSVSEPSGGGSIPCTGANTGTCIGLNEEGQASTFTPPQSSVGSSPTITGGQ